MANVKLTNTVDGDRVLPGAGTFAPVLVPAHRSAEIDSEHWGKVKDKPVIKAWLDAGEIKTGEPASKAEAQKAEGAQPPSLDDMTVAELKGYAEERNIDLGDATRKDDIRAAIDLAEQG